MSDEFSPGDIVTLTVGKNPRKGTYITSRDGHCVVKLENGYNIGVPLSCISHTFRPEPEHAPEPFIYQDETLPRLSIVSTGGTIASRIDSRSGAVTSQFDAADVLRAIPRLRSFGHYRVRKLTTILSENMTPGIWQQLARAVYEDIRDGVAGVIVTHGTDTMAYSAAALSFMLETPVPVIFVGSQRSADRPSSDSTMNALCSASAATSSLGEVAVVMHASTNDDACAIHRGTRVRKMHSSRRDAFRSIGMLPIGSVEYPSLAVHLEPCAVRRGSSEPALNESLEERCALLTFFPGMSPSVIEAFLGYAGLVISGTGLGHVSTALVQPIQKLIEEGTMVVMTSQCLHGRVCDRVYDTGRDLLKAGVIEGEDMLPETALVKMMWVLGNVKDPGDADVLMRSNLKGEYTRRSIDGF
ncbi:MAG TPA: Glu-tRNA(Gln) amidotransferase subunit GatD [Methanoregulaceae archaeon]|nr:MAG: Glu-tRNA(Gln) amidotransferase subunit GatD [Methanolinea sp.]HON81402.1 Glu-tRNA(Gln) amidotransferase subunit GatD [Methanoregulaceae archaeon]HPD10070.1 Glu-tRNA(Gln) amidotransferase subunit GatD [Methanoregulaceae archaeon]HRT15076.1 Glu-tRNA(Gln) amidotransferase subunit GatD [Methanoregulaceae archaeon]HRU30647.1 Glu-tRNA(Gln) amidotransferase subunit GatD [Methanoregulaceae archaeon]